MLSLSRQVAHPISGGKRIIEIERNQISFGQTTGHRRGMTGDHVQLAPVVTFAVRNPLKLSSRR